MYLRVSRSKSELVQEQVVKDLRDYVKSLARGAVKALTGAAQVDLAGNS